MLNTTDIQLCKAYISIPKGSNRWIGTHEFKAKLKSSREVLNPVDQGLALSVNFGD